MSISFTPGVYKDRADLQRQLDKYYKQLSLQASNNAKIKDIDNSSITRAELQLAPQFSQRNSEDKLKDSSYQRQLAYQKLSTIFSPKDVDAVLGDLIAKDEILLFNTYADKFFDDYKISANTTINMFLTNWKLFQEKLNSSDISTLGTTLTDIKSILENELTSEAGIPSEVAAFAQDLWKMDNKAMEAQFSAAFEGSALVMGFDSSGKLTQINKYTLTNSEADMNKKRIALLIQKFPEFDFSSFDSRKFKKIMNSLRQEMGRTAQTANENAQTANKNAQTINKSIQGLNQGLNSLLEQFITDPEIPLDIRDYTYDLLQMDNKDVDVEFLKTFEGRSLVPAFDASGRVIQINKYTIDTHSDADTNKKRMAILINRYPDFDFRSIDFAKIIESKKRFKNSILDELKKTTTAANSVKDEIKITQLLLAENGIKAGEIKQVLKLLQHSNEEQLQELNDSIRENGVHARETSDILREIQSESPPSSRRISEVKQTPEDYLHEITGYSEDELKELFDAVFADKNKVPFLVGNKKEKIDKSLVQDFNTMAIALLLHKYPKPKDYKFLTLSFPQITPHNSPPSSPSISPHARSRGASEILEQAIRDIESGRTDAARRSIGQINARDLSPVSRRTYEQIRNALNATSTLELDDLRRLPLRGEEKGNTQEPEQEFFGTETPPEYDDGEKKAGEMDIQNREAREYLRDLINTFDQKDLGQFKRQVTAIFRNEFKDIKDTDYVRTWSDTEGRSVDIRKSGADRFYHKKIEAIILKLYPLANLNTEVLREHDLFIPLREAGEGIKKKIPRHKSAGRYLVHVPSLQKGYLYIQYPSAWRIKHFPKRAISSDMCDMVWDLVDDKQFNSKKYGKLKAEEKKLYDEIITLIRVPPEEVKGLRDHKRVTDKERDQCMKKLKILTGEINSGNHSKKTIKELKVLLLKMIDAGYISKADSNKIMYQIMIVDN